MEVPLLAIISELNFKGKYSEKDGLNKLDKKIKFLKNSKTQISFVDMGTRRRISHDWHRSVVTKLNSKLPNMFKGTSNVLFAKELNLTPIGTMAHEFFQAFQVLGTCIETSQKEALYAWKKEYGDILSVALTDIFGTEVFIHDCDKDLLDKYIGYRHDSGCPIQWGYKMLAHFHENGIDSKEKTFIFSDSLNFEKAVMIQKEFEGKVNIVFGIGTFLTNDFDSHKALSIVIKLVKMNGKPTIKVSDEPAKVTCEDQELVDYTLSWIQKVKKFPTIKVATDIIIKNEKEEILLIKRADKSEAGYNEWALPGGYLDYFEKSKEGIVREVKEELGLDININEIKFQEIRDKYDRDPRGRTISLVHSIRTNSSKLKIKENKNEVKEYRWYSQENIPEKMAFDHLDIIKEVKDD